MEEHADVHEQAPDDRLYMEDPSRTTGAGLIDCHASFGRLSGRDSVGAIFLVRGGVHLGGIVFSPKRVQERSQQWKVLDVVESISQQLVW